MIIIVNTEGPKEMPDSKKL